MPQAFSSGADYRPGRRAIEAPSASDAGSEIGFIGTGHADYDLEETLEQGTRTVLPTEAPVDISFDEKVVQQFRRILGQTAGGS